MTRFDHRTTRRLRHLLGCIAIAASAQALATPLTIGNVAPGAGDIRVHVNGLASSGDLGYLEFVNVEIGTGPTHVQVFDADTGASLAQDDFTPQPADLYEPLVLFSRPHPETAPELMLLHTPNAGSGKRSKEALLFGLHTIDAAARPVERAGQAADVEFACVSRSSEQGSSGSSTMTSGGGSLYGSSDFSTLGTEYDTTTCSHTLVDAHMGTLLLEDVAVAAGRTTRFLVAGDGEHAPYELVALVGTQVRARSDGAPVVIGPLLESKDFWYDLTRPSQGVSLFDLPFAGVIYGTWYTFTSDGHPVWYFLDGSTETLPGWRDVRIYEMSRSSESPITQVGSAKLFFLDCNRAELRISLGSDDLRTLRADRSVPVESCDVFE